MNIDFLMENGFGSSYFSVFWPLETHLHITSKFPEILFFGFQNHLLQEIPCCPQVLIDDRLLKNRGAGLYKLSPDRINGRLTYSQENGENSIYWTGEYWAVGETVESDNVMYEDTNYHRRFVRTYHDHYKINSTHISHCPSDLGN